MGLTTLELEKVVIAERVSASISLLSTFVLMATFLLIKDFRTHPNTLIFLSSFGNIFTGAAALIGGSALSRANSALCQTQGFLLEMFMQSDPFWSCAMAVNAYLIFFHRFDKARAQKLYWIYTLTCYGLPAIPAVFCLIYKTRAKGKMYGDATIWCWIDNDWAPIRIFSYYAPIWVSIVVSFGIYIRIGVHIRIQCGNFWQAINQSEESNSKSNHDHPLSETRTTGIHVTSSRSTINYPALAVVHDQPFGKLNNQKAQYNVVISSSNRFARSGRFGCSSAFDRIEIRYYKCATLFAISILITWVPSSVNRLYGVLHPTKPPSFALNFASAMVLPLQGFWNTVIYLVTSHETCKTVWARMKPEPKSNKTSDIHLGDWWKGDSSIDLRKKGASPRSNDSSHDAIHGWGMSFSDIDSI